MHVHFVVSNCNVIVVMTFTCAQNLLMTSERSGFTLFNLLKEEKNFF